MVFVKNEMQLGNGRNFAFHMDIECYIDLRENFTDPFRLASQRLKL